MSIMDMFKKNKKESRFGSIENDEKVDQEPTPPISKQDMVNNFAKEEGVEAPVVETEEETAEAVGDVREKIAENDEEIKAL